jgi:hypothetical protein
VGLWPDTAALERAWQRDRQFVPAGDPARLAALREAWRAGIACA